MSVIYRTPWTADRLVLIIKKSNYTPHLGNRGDTLLVAQLRHCATSRKVADSISDDVIGFFSLT